MVEPNVSRNSNAKDGKSHQTAKNGPRMLSDFVPGGKKNPNYRYESVFSQRERNVLQASNVP